MALYLTQSCWTYWKIGLKQTVESYELILRAAGIDNFSAESSGLDELLSITSSPILLRNVALVTALHVYRYGPFFFS
jgi:hypothetical protein